MDMMDPGTITPRLAWNDCDTENLLLKREYGPKGDNNSNRKKDARLV